MGGGGGGAFQAGTNTLGYESRPLFALVVTHDAWGRAQNNQQRLGAMIAAHTTCTLDKIQYGITNIIVAIAIIEARMGGYRAITIGQLVCVGARVR